MTPEEEKQQRIIYAKIATKRAELKAASWIGPMLLFLLGVVFLALFFPVAFSLTISAIIIIISAWWGLTRDNAAKKIRLEIKELEAELG